jgi:UDP-N-acetylglucosamine--N-acetylmuramyl-(pentapeptide) pyrophosphoryl-undecaprenol N-acetylglucosamine transferase
MSEKNVFILAGRTGGPLLPALSIAKKLKNLTPIIIGVKNGFEVEYSKTNKLQLEFLPEAKLTLISFSKLSFLEIVVEIFNSIIMLFKLILSFFKSLHLILKYKPVMIITAGSFLGVPMAFALQFLKFFRLVKTKLIIHQQDSKVSLSNKLIYKFADKISCFFENSKKEFPSKQVTLIPNPIDYEKFDNIDINNIDFDKNLLNFISIKSKPLLLVFGGGTGAFAINKWLIDNLDSITKKFKVLHLTGKLQVNSILKIDNSSDYYACTHLHNEMPLVMNKADLVICRAGMSSISELIYLNKPAFLVPIPHSHQVNNAKEVINYFPILLQQFTLEKSVKENWLDLINEMYPKYFTNLNYPNRDEIKEILENYIIEIEKDLILDN